MLLSAGTLVGPTYILSLAGSVANAKLLWVTNIIELAIVTIRNTLIRVPFLDMCFHPNEVLLRELTCSLHGDSIYCLLILNIPYCPTNT